MDTETDVSMDSDEREEIEHAMYSQIYHEKVPEELQVFTKLPTGFESTFAPSLDCVSRTFGPNA